MSVRFDSSSDSLSISAANIVADASVFSFCVWVKRKVDTNAFASTAYLKANSDSPQKELFLETQSNGDVLMSDEYNQSTDIVLDGPSLTIDVWFFYLYTRTNTSRAFYYGTEAGGTLTKLSDTQTSNWATDIDILYLGNDPYGERFDGELAYARLWSVGVSDSEADAEWRSTTPVKTSGLKGDWQLASAATATVDSSGNSLTLTAGGTLTDGGANPTPPSATPEESPATRAKYTQFPKPKLRR